MEMQTAPNSHSGVKERTYWQLYLQTIRVHNRRSPGTHRYIIEVKSLEDRVQGLTV